MIESKILAGKKKYDLPEIMIHETEHLSLEAKLAFSLIERWGMVAAKEDGEDSSGRQKLKLLTESEIVERAFICANLAFEKARNNDLIHNIGPLSNLLKSDTKDE